jgi:hypothetical protein
LTTFAFNPPLLEAGGTPAAPSDGAAKRRQKQLHSIAPF